MTTGLVYVTGGPGSGFTFLYGVAVLMAAMVVGPMSARLTGAAAIVLYGSVSICLAMRWLPPPTDQSPDAYVLPLTELAYAGLLNVLGLLLVTVLAGDLSARLLTAGGQLRLAEASAATLARLNDDIVRSLSSGLLSTDLDGKIRTINPTGVEMLGIAADALIGRRVADAARHRHAAGALDQRDQPASRAPRATARRARRNTLSRSATRSTGSRTIDGTPIGALVLFQDLSEIARLREVAARQERLAVLGRLSAGLAHEIRNPLGSISGSVQLVRESPDLDAEERKLLGIILDEVERLDDLVTTMLQVGQAARAPAHATGPARDRSTTVVEMARARTRRGQGRSRSNASSPTTPVHGLGRPRSSAAGAVEPGEECAAGLAARHASSACARCSGARRPRRARGQRRGARHRPSQRDKVYNMFYSERTHGAGIGLALVRQIVDAHGGAIEIQSEQNQGATFIVTFPAGARAEPGPAAAAAARVAHD